MRFCLGLGGQEFVERVRRLPRAEPSQEEVRWVGQVANTKEGSATARELALKECDPQWQVWIRVRLGAERRLDVARAYRYRDWSVITQIIKRLETEAVHRATVADRMSRLGAAFEKQMSCFQEFTRQIVRSSFGGQAISTNGFHIGVVDNKWKMVWDNDCPFGVAERVESSI